MARKKRNARNDKTKNNSNNMLKQEIKDEILAIITIALSFFLIYCLWLGPGDQNSGTIGAFGRLINTIIMTLFGDGKYIFPILLLILGLGKMLRRAKWDKQTILAWNLLFLTILVYIHMQLPAVERTIMAGLHGAGGGIIGGTIAFLTLLLFGQVGTYIFLVACLILAILVIAKRPLTVLLKEIAGGIKRFFVKVRDELEDFLFVQVEEQEEKKVEQKERNLRKKQTEKTIQEKKHNIPLIVEYEENTPADVPEMAVGVSPALVRPVRQESNETSGANKNTVAEETSVEAADISLNTYQNSQYCKPAIDLLQAPTRIKSQRMNKDITENVRILEETLENFGVKAHVTQVSRGPSITQYEIQPAPGVRVSRIVNLADDIALSLAATQVRIEAPIPGKAAVGIEVPNEEIAMVSLREVLESPGFQESQTKLTIALGKDIAGNPIVADLAKMPHLLIAGATGSGKSVCMNSIIASILFKATPDEVKLLMIDPKVVELTNYNGIPHLISPVVTEPKKAASSLRWAVHEMENRYELFAAAGVKDITRYNELIKEDSTGTVPLLPYIVVLIDELADLMMVAPADVEDAICRLAQMARAAGIHLVVATQRPSVDVITGIIKANIPSRIAFAVSSQTDSRTILDMGGAEKLLGRGDMLFYPTGMAKPIRVQGVFVSDQEIDKLVEFLKNQISSQYITPWVQTEEETQEESDDDELLPEAARIFIESGQASISLLQRRLRIGYTRAARIVDQMEEKGIIGGYEGSKARTVHMTWEEYEKTFGI